MFNDDNNKKMTVLVLLSTYNGEKYLDEQLKSLYRQKGVNLHILIRDDGSTDSTVKKIEEYESRYNNTTVLIEKNIGCSLSFKRLMNYAKTMLPVFNYYAFCDQDDVWDDDKLMCAVECLEKNKANLLRLYTSAYRVVDEKMNFQYIQQFKYKHTLGESLIMINKLGCTQVYSHDLMEQALKICHVDSYSSGMPNHDGWLYLTAITLSSYIYHDDNPHINYRQHGNNVSGANQASFINRFKRTLKGKNIRSRIAKILIETYDDIEENKKQLLRLNITYSNSFRTKLKLLFLKEMSTNTLSINIAFRILILFNNY